MALPAFNDSGDLPEGIHLATWDEMVSRFGTNSPKRYEVASRLKAIRELASATRGLDRLIVFGSFVSDAESPRDVDVILVMRDEFRIEQCPTESRILFDHLRAETELGASVFWIRADMLLGEPLDHFLSHWQVKREGGRRGIVEIAI